MPPTNATASNHSKYQSLPAVGSRDNNNVSRKEAEIKQASGERQNTVDELLAGLASVAGNGERRSSVCGGYAAEALADMRVRVIGHLRN